MNRRAVGDLGEALAAERLVEEGYRIRARNFRTRLGEVDLIADEGDRVVFIEVKTRTSLSRGLPVEAVDRRKRRRLVRAAFQYLSREQEERPCRFDVVEVVILDAQVYEVRIIRDAFEPEEADLESVWM